MNQKKKMVLLYLGSVIVYGIIASLFTSTVHIDVDEELYLALAKSFHYNGRFEYGGELLDYSCILYSMLISLAYYFYSPETILLSMRIIGVVVMCSSVFPNYLLAKEILRDEKKAFYITVFLNIMPYMFDSAYLMQEVLSYPLFMWTLYFMYQSFEKKEKKHIYLILASVFSVLCVFTKTYMFFIPITLNLCIGYHMLKDRCVKEHFVKTVIYDGIYLLLFAGVYLLIFVINGFEKGSNHYSSQISQLFPIGWNTIIFGTLGCGVYMVFLIMNTGFLPISTVFSKWYQEKNKSWFNSFIVVSIVFLILEIVFMIVLTEEGARSLPHKFLFRYFHIFVPPILILFVKHKDESKLITSVKYVIAMEASLCAAIVYFFHMQGETRQAIIDGHLFLFLQNVSKYIIPYADVMAMLALMICLIVIYLWCRKKSDNIQRVLKLAIVGMMLFWIVEVVQLPYYNNVIAGGKQIQSDSIKIARYLNEENYESVYFVYKDVKEKNSYTRNFYGYIKQSYRVVSETELNDLLQQEESIAFLSCDSLTSNENELTEIELNNERLFLYILP